MPDKNIKSIIPLYLRQRCANAFFPSDHKEYDNGWTLEGIDASMVKLYKLSNSTDFTWTEEVHLILRPWTDITEEEMQEIWVVIGGTPHLYEWGKDDLKKGLEVGDWGESGIQMDYYTMSCMINYLRSRGIDVDDLIDSGFAIDKTKM